MPTALVVCPPACFEVQLRVEGRFEVASPLPEGFDDDEGRRLFDRHVGAAACKVVRASLFDNLPYSLQDVFISADRDINRRHPSFVGNADIDAFEERNLIRRRGRGLLVVEPRSWRLSLIHI